jgi:hypothetical protein
MAVDFPKSDLTLSFVLDALYSVPTEIAQDLVCYIDPNSYQQLRYLRDGDGLPVLVLDPVTRTEFIFGAWVQVVPTSRTILVFAPAQLFPRQWGIWNEETGWYRTGIGIMFYTDNLAVAVHQCVLANKMLPESGQRGRYAVRIINLPSSDEEVVGTKDR